MASPLAACDQPDAHVADNTDCNDTREEVSPIAAEICDPSATDENCNGFADDADGTVDPTSMTTWFIDADGDGFGAAGSEYLACVSTSGSVNALDCDDTRADLNPGATDVPDDSVDQDCDGADATGDGSDTGDGGSDDDGKLGCASLPGSTVPGFVVLLALPVLLRRRRA